MRPHWTPAMEALAKKIHGQIQRLWGAKGPYPDGIREGEDGWPEHVGCGDLDPGAHIGGVTVYDCCGCEKSWRVQGGVWTEAKP